MRNLLTFFTAFSIIHIGLWTTPASAHHGHTGPTYEVTSPKTPDVNRKRLRLDVRTEESDEPIAARFSLLIDGRPYIPQTLNAHGIRFVSIHTSKKQRTTTLYARGSGPVELELPDDARQGEVVVTKGYEYGSRRIPFEVKSQQTSITAHMKRWSNMRDEGWLPADEHLHYDRIDPKHDKDWLAMLSADDLTHGHFMVLKGGNLPGIWAKQFAYGKDGQATDGKRLIVPGEEFRDRRQGHINLLGLGYVIQPISIGGIGSPPHRFNYPTLHDVFLEARKSGGIGGPAHGGSLAQNSTAAVDIVLGAAEFMEIANTYLYRPELWYRLMNCGFMLPPVAGTDLRFRPQVGSL